MRHNLPATGGASGSAIFLPTGEVVAALNAGNVLWELVRGDDGQVKAVYRQPNAALVNYAQRVDILYDLLQ